MVWSKNAAPLDILCGLSCRTYVCPPPPTPALKSTIIFLFDFHHPPTPLYPIMKLAVAALLVASAAAFAPAQTGRSATSLAVNELEIGAVAPLGVFDPLGWLDSEPEAFERRRAVERKHGRVAMAAITGVIVHNNHITFDGYLSPSANLKFSDVPTGVDGIRAIPTAGLLQILFFFALVELAWMPASKYDVELAGLLLGILDVIPEPSDPVIPVVLRSRHPRELDESEEE